MGTLARFGRKLGFFSKFKTFQKLNEVARPDLPANWKDRWPQLDDATGTLPFDAHYVYHTAWAARVVAEIKPVKHIDISSYTYFATLVSAFIPVDFYDFRPANIKLSNMTSGAADLCNLHFKDRSIDSISCMHTIEHIGLGRYGDPIDPNGDRRALSELQRVVAEGGSLLIVVPIGKPRIQYNAHRIYDPEMIKGMLPDLQLHTWSLLPDDSTDGLIEDPSRDFALQQRYGCGCFWFKRHATKLPTTAPSK